MPGTLAGVESGSDRLNLMHEFSQGLSRSKTSIYRQMESLGFSGGVGISIDLKA